MAKDCVFKVEAHRGALVGGRYERSVSISANGHQIFLGWMSVSEWSAFRSGLMPNSHVDFIIEEEEDEAGNSSKAS